MVLIAQFHMAVPLGVSGRRSGGGRVGPRRVELGCHFSVFRDSSGRTYHQVGTSSGVLMNHLVTRSFCLLRGDNNVSWN